MKTRAMQTVSYKGRLSAQGKEERTKNLGSSTPVRRKSSETPLWTTSTYLGRSEKIHLREMEWSDSKTPGPSHPAVFLLHGMKRRDHRLRPLFWEKGGREVAKKITFVRKKKITYLLRHTSLIQLGKGISRRKNGVVLGETR